MTSQGTAHGRFQRAIQRRQLFAAEIAARELGALSLSDALALCLLYEAENDPRFERAMRRWLSRTRREHALRHEQVELLLAAAGALRTPFRRLAVEVLSGACGELGMPVPTSLSEGVKSSARTLREGRDRA